LQLEPDRRVPLRGVEERSWCELTDRQLVVPSFESDPDAIRVPLVNTSNS
jgi:hypothetical protein